MSAIFETPSMKLNMAHLNELTSFAFSLLPWGVPAVMAAGWCVYPALTTSFKQSIGIEKVPPSNQEFIYEKGEIGEAPELVSGSV